PLPQVAAQVQHQVADAVHLFAGPPPDLAVVQLADAVPDPLVPVRQPPPGLGQKRRADVRRAHGRSFSAGGATRRPAYPARRTPTARTGGPTEGGQTERRPPWRTGAGGSRKTSRATSSWTRPASTVTPAGSWPRPSSPRPTTTPASAVSRRRRPTAAGPCTPW